MEQPKKPVILTDTERQALINKIKNQAARNPEYAKHVEQKLEDHKKQIELKSSKFQAIYGAMPKEMQQRMDEKMEILKEKAKTNPVIAKMLNNEQGEGV